MDKGSLMIGKYQGNGNFGDTPHAGWCDQYEAMDSDGNYTSNMNDCGYGKSCITSEGDGMRALP